MVRPDFERTQRVVDLEGEVHLWDFGGSGPLTLLIHGLGGSRANWSAVADDFSGDGRLVVPDLIGFGDTPPLSRSSGVDRQVELVIDLLEHLDQGPAVLVGNSMGGLISMLVAAKRPDLVDRLVLVAAAAPTARPHFKPTALLRLAVPLVPGIGGALVRIFTKRDDPEAMLDQTLQFLMVDPARMAAPDREVAIAFGARHSQMPWAIDAFRDAARSIATHLFPPQRLAREVAKIEAPTLVIQGDSDEVVPPATADWLASRRPDWDFHMMEDIGHVPQLEAPKELMAVVEPWLEATVPANR